VDVPADHLRRQRHVEGFPLGGFWTRPYTFEDVNSDGMIDQTEIHMAPLDSVIDSDKVLGRKYMGNVLPTREASLSTSIGLFQDKLRINARMDYVGGNMQYNNTGGFRCIATGNNCRAIMDPSAPLWEQAGRWSAASSTAARSSATSRSPTSPSCASRRSPTPCRLRGRGR
jgi:hypothetical protein